MNTRPRKHSTLAPIIKTTLFLFLALLPTIRSFATDQIADELIYESKEYAIHSDPILEEYFSKNKSARPTGGDLITALYRGYMAIFEIKEGWLYAKEVNIYTGHDSSTHKIQWKNVIGDIFKTEKDKRLDWFSGLLILPHGNPIIHSDHGFISENYILLEINNGKCVKEKKLSGTEAYDKFRKKQFELFKQTDEYKKALSERIKYGYKKKEAERFLESYVLYYSKKILVD